MFCNKISIFQSMNRSFAQVNIFQFLDANNDRAHTGDLVKSNSIFGSSTLKMGGGGVPTLGGAFGNKCLKTEKT